MENKKNKNVDLSRRSSLFFQIGLILALFLVWQLIEWDIKPKEVALNSVPDLEISEEVVIPITQIKEQLPPPPPRDIVQPPEIIKNDKNLVETIVAPTEPEEKISKVDEIVFTEVEEPVDDYSINAVDVVPVFPGCENLDSNSERISCLNEKLNKFVSRKFDTSIGSDLGLTGVHRIYVSFKINKEGIVEVIGARGPHPDLEKEAIRVAKSLPEMQPGRQGDRAVGVTYSLPIIFRVE